MAKNQNSASSMSASYAHLHNTLGPKPLEEIDLSETYLGTPVKLVKGKYYVPKM